MARSGFSRVAPQPIAASLLSRNPSPSPETDSETESEGLRRRFVSFRSRGDEAWRRFGRRRRAIAHRPKRRTRAPRRHRDRREPRGPSRARCEPHSFVAATRPVSLRWVERDAARPPPSLSSKVSIVPSNLANHGRNLTKRFDDERTDPKHDGSPLVPRSGPPPRYARKSRASNPPASSDSETDSETETTSETAYSGTVIPFARRSSRSSSSHWVNVRATSGSNCDPEQRSISVTATSCGSAPRYARSLVIAS